jgi:hypothetical protein
LLRFHPKAHSINELICFLKELTPASSKEVLKEQLDYSSSESPKVILVALAESTPISLKCAPYSLDSCKPPHVMMMTQK